MAQVPSHVDTSAALGSKPLAQVAVYPPGSYWAFIARTQGRWIARIALGRRPDLDHAQTPLLRVSHSAAQVAAVAPGPVVAVPVAQSGSVLAVTSQELALIRYGLHGVSLRAGQVLLRMPRSEVKAAQLGRGWPGMIGTAPAPLTIVLVNGDTWRLEVFWIDKRRAKALVRALTAQQPYQGQPSGQQPYPGPGRRKRRKVLAAITGAVVAAIGIIVGISIALAGHGSHTATTGQAAATTMSSASKAANPASPASPASPAQIGSVIVLTGDSPGEKMAVTVVKVFPQPQPAGQFNVPQQGDRLYAVQFRLDDIGSVAYSDAPSNGAVVVDAAGQSYQSSLYDVAGCRSFPATENIAVGSSGVGCVVFEVPATARITKVQFTLDSGFGPQTGQWDVRR